MTFEAHAKLNLCLYVGAPRDDGLHEIASLFLPLDLADAIEVTRDAERDEVICPGVEGPELGAAALAALRDAGWSAPPVRIEIEKRIPVAAGLGGGSADAAAVLGLARDELGEDALRAIAGGLGADVTSQLDPRFALVGGAGEVVTPLADPDPVGIVLVPLRPGLSAAEVYAESDRQGGGRDSDELRGLSEQLRAAADGGASPLDYTELLVNDLQPAAQSLHPDIAGALDALAGAGAARALVTGSGPTAFGLFRDVEEARAAAGNLAPAHEALAVSARIGGA